MTLRRAVLALVTGLTATLLDTAWGQSPYPTRPIRMISPFPPGAVVDTLSRALASPARAARSQAS